MRRVKGQTGMSLVEATIILLVLMMLTGALAPSIFDFVIDAKLVLVKEDCEAIGISIARLVRDVGPCLMQLWAANGCTMNNRIDIMYSMGAVPLIDPALLPSGNININTRQWINDPGPTFLNPANPNLDQFEDQLVLNMPRYPLPGAAQWTFIMPKFLLGWRGPYVPPPIEMDPWGHLFQVNTGFLAVANDATPGFGEGERWGGWNQNVICLSAGPNGIIQTWYPAQWGGLWSQPNSDDFIYVISGDTR